MFIYSIEERERERLLDHSPFIDFSSRDKSLIEEERRRKRKKESGLDSGGEDRAKIDVRGIGEEGRKEGRSGEGKGCSGPGEI